MVNILLLVFSIICFLSQVGYSIFYSVGIVDVSTQVNQAQKQLESNQIELQKIKAQYYELNSLSSLKANPSTSSLNPITKTIRLLP